ncbi:LAME_0G09010g1_1 [Lachancea meyersii CBS 8951]|uniref:LAME_0G09010g1_1 n=1 Tax=Lachancea meyersii CBS 8951 TaxID=1266667 RepID=A0A1G4K8H4_9SACH|nr:LAME_0G09010g1_1 [Lachancea meyersii CBS 8951]
MNGQESNSPDVNDTRSPSNDTPVSSNKELLDKTKLLRDTLELLLDRSEEQRKQCDQLSHENRYLQDYIENLMSQGNVLDK